MSWWAVGTLVILFLAIYKDNRDQGDMIQDLTERIQSLANIVRPLEPLSNEEREKQRDRSVHEEQ